MAQEKMFIRYSGTKTQFIESGLATKYNKSIVFIGEGKDSCVYTHGQYFADINAALVSLKYFSGVRVNNGEAAFATAPNQVLTFNTKDETVFEASTGSDGITLGLSDAFITKVNNKADKSELIPYATADKELSDRLDVVEGAVGTGGSVDSKIAQAIAGLAVDESGEDYVKTIKQVNGKIVATTGTFNFDIAGAADSAKNAVIGTANDGASAVTIYGAKKYAEEKANAAKSGAEATASADATSKANTAESNANTYTDNAILGLNADKSGESADKHVSVQVVETAGKITNVVVTANDIASAQELANVKADVDYFLGGALNKENADALKDTLKEIQNYIDSDVEGAAGMAASIKEAKDAADDAQAAADKAQGEVDDLEQVVAGVKATADAAATQKALDDEIDRAKQAEKENKDAIALLNDADTKVGSVAYAVKTAKDDLTLLINDKVSNGDFESGVSNLNEAIQTAKSGAETYAKGLVEALDQTDSIIAGQYVSSVSQEDGKITVTHTELPSLADSAVDGKYVSAVKQVNGQIEVTRADIPTHTLVSGDANGQVKFDGVNVDVKGLGDAAFVGKSTFATAAQGANADSALSKATANENLIKAMNLSKVSGYITEIAQLNGNVTATSVANIPGADVTVEVVNTQVAFTSTNVKDAINELVDFWAWEEIDA